MERETWNLSVQDKLSGFLTDRKKAEVLQEAGTRSYEVQTSDGGVDRRNRRALVEIPNSDSFDPNVNDRNKFDYDRNELERNESERIESEHIRHSRSTTNKHSAESTAESV